MGLLTLEHSKAAYRTDFALYASAVAGLAGFLMLAGPEARRLAITTCAFAGTHHWRSDNAWLRRRKRWHALHHHTGHPGFYGVTSPFRDHVFGSKRAGTRSAGT